MGLKIISGIMVIDAASRNEGIATLNLNTATFGSSDPVTTRDVQILGDGPYLGRPCVQCAVCNFRGYVGDISDPDSVDWRLIFDLVPHGSANPSGMHIVWQALHRYGGGSGYIVGDEIREVSFLVIGFTADSVIIRRPTLERARKNVRRPKSVPQKPPKGDSGGKRGRASRVTRRRGK